MKVDFHRNCSVDSAISWQFIGTSSFSRVSIEVAREHKISTAVQSLFGNPRPYLIKSRKHAIFAAFVVRLSAAAMQGKKTADWNHAGTSASINQHEVSSIWHCSVCALASKKDVSTERA